MCTLTSASQQQLGKKNKSGPGQSSAVSPGPSLEDPGSPSPRWQRQRFLHPCDVKCSNTGESLPTIDKAVAALATVWVFRMEILSQAEVTGKEKRL